MLYRLRGLAYDTLGEFEHARADYERAVHAAHESSERETQWQAEIDLGFLWAGRDYERAGSFFREAVLLAETLPDLTLRAHSLNRLGNWLVNTGQVQEGLAAHQQALDVFERQHDQAGMAETYALLGMAQAWTGDIVQGAQQQQRAIVLFRELGDKKALISTLPTTSLETNPAANETVFVVVGLLEKGERDVREAVELARQIGWSAGEAFAEVCMGSLLAGIGQFGRGLAHAHKGLQIAQEIDHQQWICNGYFSLGQIYILMLEPVVALHYLRSGLPLAKALGSAWFMDSILAYQALAHLQSGQFAQAQATLQTAMPREQEPRTLSGRRTAWVWGELALAQGEAQVALQIAERLIASVPGEERTQPIPRLLKLKGEALVASKRLSEAVEALEEAKRGALERREAPLLWQIYASLGRAYRSLKLEEQAREALTAAQEGIESLAQTIDDARLREHFLQRALAFLPRAKPLSPRRAATEKFGGLTEREREVVTLIAQGKTSREIADLLVISERTAEGHVSNILGKLGFTSRTQIAAWAIEQGLPNR
jgi:DNA-binding CsgD family transcriptional regulator/tetratricopeptide (TPR) repeat protein